MTDSFRPTVLRGKAWDALRGKWGQAAVACLLIYVAYCIVCGLSILVPLLGFLVILFAASIVFIGFSFIFWDVYKGANVEIKTVLEPVQDYVRYLIGFLLMCLYTFLWSLLLYIPGIIKALSYSMTFYIMRENPEMSGEQAIQRSMAMMKGHKMELFLLSLSFLGWILLGIITLGIGLLWVYPYMYTAQAAFYEELKKDYEARQAFEAQPAVTAAA